MKNCFELLTFLIFKFYCKYLNCNIFPETSSGRTNVKQQIYDQNGGFALRWRRGRRFEVKLCKCVNVVHNIINMSVHIQKSLDNKYCKSKHRT